MSSFAVAFIASAGPERLPPELWRVITRYKFDGWRYLQHRKVLPHKAHADLTPHTCSICRLLWQVWQSSNLSSHMLTLTDEATWLYHDTWYHKDVMTDIDTHINFTIYSKPMRNYKGYLFKWCFQHTTYYLAWSRPHISVIVITVPCVGKHTVQCIVTNGPAHGGTVNVTYDIRAELVWVSWQSFDLSPIPVVAFTREQDKLYGRPDKITFGYPNDILNWDMKQLKNSRPEHTHTP